MLKTRLIHSLKFISAKFKAFWRVDLLASRKRLARSPFYQLIFSLISTTFCSLALTFFIFQTYNRSLNIATLTWLFDDENNQVFLWSWFVVFLLDLILLAIFNRTIIANLSLTVVSVIWLFVNQVKMTSRQSPFLPEDLFFAGEAGRMTALIQSEDFYFLIRSLVLILIMSLSAYFIYNLILRYPKPSRRRRWLASGLLLVIGAGGLLNIYRQLHDPDLMTTHQNLIHNAIISCCQSSNYYWNGPVIGFMSNIGKIALDKPTEYSEEVIRRIVDKYQPSSDKTTTPDQQPVNLVLILSESLTDPGLFQEYYSLKNDPISFVHWLQQNQPSGWLAGSEYGGGTANIESDLLTSMSTMLNNNTTPFTNFLPKISNFPSLANTLKLFGYQTSALHNYDPQMYKRNLVYPNIGIDKFYSLDDFAQTSTIDRNTYDSDESFFATLLEHLRREPQQAKFINGVTMQNHAPYDDIYDLSTQWAERGELSDGDYNRLENYLTGINYSDQALRKFYSDLQQLEQKTLVVVYGDHLPGSNVFQRVAEVDSKLAHLTPIVTLANFELDFELFGELSANYLASAIFEALGWSKSGYYTMLDQLRQRFPSLTSYEVVDQTVLDNDPIYQDYALIQYDLLNGARYSQKLGFFDVKK